LANVSYDGRRECQLPPEPWHSRFFGTLACQRILARQRLNLS
jgi:hypothetical protein